MQISLSSYRAEAAPLAQPQRLELILPIILGLSLYVNLEKKFIIGPLKPIIQNLMYSIRYKFAVRCPLMPRFSLNLDSRYALYKDKTFIHKYLAAQTIINIK